MGDRIAPKDDPVMPCQPDTAGKVTRDDSVLNEDGRGRVVDVDTARPRQYIYQEGHLIRFCECKDWASYWPEDREWCRKYQWDINERFFEHPYNFESDGFDMQNGEADIDVEFTNGGK